MWLSESEPEYIPSIEMDFLGDYILVSQKEWPDMVDNEFVPRTQTRVVENWGCDLRE